MKYKVHLFIINHSSLQLPTAPITNKCDINTDDSDDLAFSCRSFVIRYRGELHELNDAVHWRLTVPKVLFFSNVLLFSCI